MSNEVIFSHANGYPAGSYRALTQAIGRERGIQPFDHRPMWGDPPPGLLKVAAPWQQSRSFIA